jgi:polysaccharide biosynthesis protein PslJ
VAYTEPAAERRMLPIVLVTAGAGLFVALLPFGSKATLAGGIAFLIAVVIALADSTKPVFTWPNAIASLVLVIWFVPIKLYALPIELPFNLEPYRLYLLLLVFAWVVQTLRHRGRLDAAGRTTAIALLIGVAIISTAVNFDTLRAGADQSPLNPVFYFISFLLLFVLVASTIDLLPNADQILRALVLGGTVVAVFAVYEARTRYNFFDHLSEFVPILDKQEREVLELRGGRLRVHASSQHPIAFGVALIMILPFAVYLAQRASTVVRARLWWVAAILCATAAASTVSRTTVLMVVGMAIVAFRLRRQALIRYWPVLLILPVAIHFVAPGALGGLYKSFFPKEGLLSDVQGRAGEAGSGRFADVVPGLRIWSESPIVGHGLGSTIEFEQEEAHLGLSPIPPVIFDNQYMATLVQLGVLGLLGAIMLVWGSVIRLFRAAKHSTGPPGDLLTACAVSCAGFGVSMFFYDAFAFAQTTIVFIFVAALGLRVARLQRQPILVESRITTV